MFWGLQLEPNLRYSQQVPAGFRITKATLNPESPAAQSLVQVFVQVEGSEYAIATMKHGSIYDCPLDLRFDEGEDICFFIKGEGTVFLTGHNLYIDDSDDDVSFYPGSKGALMADSDEESEDDDVSDEGDDSDDSISDGPQIEDITLLNDKTDRDSIKTTNGTVAVSKKNTLGQLLAKDDDNEDDEDDDEDFNESAGDEESGEEGLDSEESDDDDEEEEDDDDEDDDDDDAEDDEEFMKMKATPGSKRSEVAAQLKTKTPEAKKAKLQNGSAATPRSNDTASKNTSESIQSGKKSALAHKTNESVKELVVEDIRVGSGPVAKKGKNVSVYYTGTLLNGKMFDSLVKGKPFQFKLGTASVIKGWDKGLEGMRVGGKRRLVIPSSMAYGKQKMGPIPAHSALRFEVELKAVS